MRDEELHKAFLKAVDFANNYDKILPTDIKLQFYAHYKHAVEDIGFYKPSDEIELRNAFKINALFQVKRITKEEAKHEYIRLVEKYLT